MNSEFKEQCMVFTWANFSKAKHPCLAYLNSSLNGVKLSIFQAKKAKAAGMVRGYPDINLPIKNKFYNGLYIELKIKYKNGKRNSLTEEQKDWIDQLNKQGYFARVCYGAAEAIDVIKAYIEDIYLVGQKIIDN